MGIPRSLRLERSLSLEEGDMVSVREDGDEWSKGEKGEKNKEICYCGDDSQK
jgi:hypothetical protein